MNNNKKGMFSSQTNNVMGSRGNKKTTGMGSAPKAAKGMGRGRGGARKGSLGSGGSPPRA